MRVTSEGDELEIQRRGSGGSGGRRGSGKKKRPVLTAALCFLAFGVGAAGFPATAGVFVAALLFFRFGDDGRYLDAVAVFVDGDEGQVGGADVAMTVFTEVLDPDFYADFH